MSAQDGQRRWLGALAWGAGAALFVMAVAVSVNLAFGRTIHWDKVGLVTGAGLASLTLIGRLGR